MDLHVKGKTALVTGSTSGIGKAIVASLIAEGAVVIVNGRREEKVNETINDIKDPISRCRPSPGSIRFGDRKRMS